MPASYRAPGDAFRAARVILLIAVAAFASHAAWSQSAAPNRSDFPNRPVRLIVGFAPGTGPDILARLLAQKLSQAWGNVGVVVDNKAGAGGMIASVEAARSPPDGYTLFLGVTGNMVIAPAIYRKLAYDPQKDFVPVSQVADNDFVLLVNPQKTPARHVKDFVAWSTKQPNGIFMGTFGAGTPGHFGAYIFGDAVKLRPEVVHYKNTSDAIGGVMMGDVQAMFASVGVAAAQVKGGKLIALASTGSTRNASLPNVPTMKEEGYPNLEFVSWFGIVAPGKTPADLVARLNADIQAVVHQPNTRAAFEAAGFTATGTSSEAFATIIASDRTVWGKAIAETGFKAD